MPADVTIKPIFDQSIFVKAALNSVVMGGMMAAGLTALMILLFLGNWRLTLIILASIPLSIVTALLLLYGGGQTLNTMTLGGFALAVGILVDNSTVVIENMERHVGLGEDIETAILNGTDEVGIPTLLSTLAICVVFVPVFLLTGTAKYLFSPLSLSVILSLCASLVLSFTLVPVLFKYLFKPHDLSLESKPKRFNPFSAFHAAFEHGFLRFRDGYRSVLTWVVSNPLAPGLFFLLLAAGTVLPATHLGMDFFPAIDAGQMRLHVRAPPGTRIEQTQAYFAKVEKEVRNIVGNDQIDVILDNIGLPYSGINIALSDSATVGPHGRRDPDLLEGEPHADCCARGGPASPAPEALPRAAVLFPAGRYRQSGAELRPARADRHPRLRPRTATRLDAVALKLARDLKACPGIVDSHVFQVPDAPAVKIDVDRAKARDLQIDDHGIASDLLVALNSSAQTSPNFWLNPSQRGRLPARRADADLSRPLVARRVDSAGHRAVLGRESGTHERCQIRPDQASDDCFASELAACFRRERRCSGA